MIKHLWNILNDAASVWVDSFLMRYGTLQTRLEAYVRQGLVRKQTHPVFPLTVYKYTRTTEFGRHWDDVTRKARGVVFDDKGNRLNAVFPKFFNYEEMDELPTGDYEVYKKLDGTGIVLMWYKGHPIVHTLGSFESPQAIAAGEWLSEYGYAWADPNRTYIFEWMDPNNDVTLRYTGEKKLVLIAAFLTKEWLEIPIEYVTEWEGEKAEKVRAAPLWKLKVFIRDDEEGYVIVYENGERLKVKGTTFFALHRIKSGLSRRRIWESIYENNNTEKIRVGLDEENRMWYDSVVEEMRQQLDSYRFVGEKFWSMAEVSENKIETIKTFPPMYRTYCFAKLGNKDAESILIRLTRNNIIKGEYCDQSDPLRWTSCIG